MRTSFSQKLLGTFLLIAIGIIILPFVLLHEKIANPNIHQYKSVKAPPSLVDHKGVIGFIMRLKTHTQLLLHKPPRAWMIKSSNVLSETDANNIVADLHRQEISAYIEVVNPSTKTARIQLGPVIKHKEAEALLAKLQASFPQVKGVIVGYDPMED